MESATVTMTVGSGEDVRSWTLLAFNATPRLFRSDTLRRTHSLPSRLSLPTREEGPKKSNWRLQKSERFRLPTSRSPPWWSGNFESGLIVGPLSAMVMFPTAPSPRSLALLRRVKGLLVILPSTRHSPRTTVVVPLKPLLFPLKSRLPKPSLVNWPLPPKEPEN